MWARIAAFLTVAHWCSCVLGEGRAANGVEACGADQTGIYSTDQTVCCPARCGTCGGEKCGSRFPGSAALCCQAAILSSEVLCGTPPCIPEAPALRITQALADCKTKGDSKAKGDGKHEAKGKHKAKEKHKGKRKKVDDKRKGSGKPKGEGKPKAGGKRNGAGKHKGEVEGAGGGDNAGGGGRGKGKAARRRKKGGGGTGGGTHGKGKAERGGKRPAKAGGKGGGKGGTDTGVHGEGVDTGKDHGAGKLKGAKCKHRDELCGARWIPGTNLYSPRQVSVYTTCCPLFQGTTCRATALQADGTFGTACESYKYCEGDTTACNSSTFAMTVFGQSVEQVCCPPDMLCVTDKSSRFAATKCVAKKACPKEGETPCGRGRVDGVDTANDICCPKGKHCYLVDLPSGDYKSVCSTCDVPCGRARLKDRWGNDRCCLPKQVCRPAFNGLSDVTNTECVYPFKCRKHTCKHGGKCINNPSPYSGHTGTFKRCKCPNGFNGVFCEIAKAAAGT